MNRPGDPPAASRTRLETAEEHAAVYAAVIESALDAVIVVDEDGVVVTLNPAAEATFGYRRDEAVGQPIAALIVPGHLRSAHEDGMARYRRSGERRVLGRRVVMEACRKDGTSIPVELAITEVRLSDARLFTANLRDLSPARAAEAEIFRQRELLHQSEKLAALGSLLASVAHELNNPLSIVLGQATLLREEAADWPQAAALGVRIGKIETAAQRCARVVRSFLAIARQREAVRRPVALAPLVSQSIDLVGYGLESSGVAVERNIPADLPDALADPDQVQQILINLLVNAGQALEAASGPRRIGITAQAAGGMLRLVVSDNGPGVPAAIAARIFDPFFTTKASGVGTGIGLSVSRGLAEAQGGELVLLDTAQGAAFELALPLVQTSQAAREAETQLPAAGSRPALRALVIDDEPEIADLVAETLERAGWRCDRASGGREGQALISAAPAGFDAIVCDLRMPDLDGVEFLRWLSQRHPALASRTLFVTGDALGAAAGRLVRASGRPVLEKPFAPADLVRMLAALVENNPPRA